MHGPAATIKGTNEQAKLDKDLQNSCILKAFISKYPLRNLGVTACLEPEGERLALEQQVSP